MVKEDLRSVFTLGVLGEAMVVFDLTRFIVDAMFLVAVIFRVN